MVPLTYLSRQVEDVLKKADIKSLFHWTSVNSFKSIVSRREILSKGSVWGLGIQSSTRRTTQVDTLNGFVDYVFLGVCNWKEKGLPSHYGEIGLEVCSSIILEREFFVFPRNTGMNWASMVNCERDSDLHHLRSALQNGCRTAEILVRRRVVLGSENLIAVHCPNSDCHGIEDMLVNSGLTEVKVSGYSVGGVAMQCGSARIEIKHPILTEDRVEYFEPRDYLEENDSIWISKTELSCVLELKKSGEDLLDPKSHQKFGRIIKN